MKNLLTFSFFLLLSINSHASLTLMPTRVEFDYKKDLDQMKNVRLSNSSDERVAYKISFQHLKMEESGKLVEIKSSEKSDQGKFSDNLIMFSPRRVILEPRSSQVIRLLLKKSPDLALGEYRSHLLVSQEDLAANNEASNEKNKKISVSLRALLAISIPVIVNSGEKNGKIGLGDVALKENSLSVELLRSGNSTIYGDLLINSTDGKEIGSVESMSIFYPQQKREVLVKLKKKPAEGEKVEVVFYERKMVNELYEADKSRALIKKLVTLSQ
jgi:hypothetical protein